jgi:hypothetical protein
MCGRSSFVLSFPVPAKAKGRLAFPFDPVFFGGQSGEFALCSRYREKLIGPEL